MLPIGVSACAGVNLRTSEPMYRYPCPTLRVGPTLSRVAGLSPLTRHSLIPKVQTPPAALRLNVWLTAPFGSISPEPRGPPPSGWRSGIDEAPAGAPSINLGAMTRPRVASTATPAKTTTTVFLDTYAVLRLCIGVLVDSPSIRWPRVAPTELGVLTEGIRDPRISRVIAVDRQIDSDKGRGLYPAAL